MQHSEIAIRASQGPRVFEYVRINMALSMDG